MYYLIKFTVMNIVLKNNRNKIFIEMITYLIFYKLLSYCCNHNNLAYKQKNNLLLFLPTTLTKQGTS